MAKTPPNTNPIVSDWLAANDDVYIPRNREKPVLTVLDGKEFAYLDYHSAVQMGKKLQAEAFAQSFSAMGRGIKRFLSSTVPSLARSLWRRLKFNHQTGLAVAELSRLSPELLKDIGLTAGDISVVASGRIRTDELSEIRRSGWPY